LTGIVGDMTTYNRLSKDPTQKCKNRLINFLEEKMDLSQQTNCIGNCTRLLKEDPPVAITTR